MKKTLLLILTGIAFAGNAISQNTKGTVTIPAAVAKKHGQLNDGEANAPSRMKWEQQRLADPATGRIPSLIRARELTFAATLPKDDLIPNGKISSTINWNFRGPWNRGGRTRAFAIDVTNENILLAGSVSGGMWRSTDGGATWTRTSSVNGHPDVISLAQDTRPGHTDTWYYLSGEAYGTSSSGGAAFFLGNGMYKSTDGGLTWNSLPATVSGTPHTFDNIWDVAWNVVTNPAAATQDVVYAATYGAIWKSTNGGTSWTIAKGTTTNNAYFTDVAVSSTGKVYCSLSSDGGVKGIYRSPDGITWTNILPANFPAVYDRQVIGIDPNNENIVYFFGPTPGSGRVSTDFQGDTLYNSLWKYEYLSGNGTGLGGVWTNLSQNLPGNINMFNGMNTQGGYDAVVRVKPGNSNVVFIGGTNIYRSTSAFADSLNTTVIGGYAIGATLPFVDSYPGHHSDQHGLTFLPSNPDILFSNHDGGISKTLDNTATPVVWNELNDGYISSQFYTITMDHSATDSIIIGGLQDNGTYYTNNANALSPWVHSFDGDGAYCAITSGGANYYFSKQLGRVAKTTVDANGNMTAYRRIDPIGATNYDFINPLVIDPNDEHVMYLPAGNKMWRNDDLSAIALTNQWDTISTNWVTLPDTLTAAGEQIVAVAISHIPAHRLYYGTNKHKVFRVDNANTGSPTAVNITASTMPAAGNVSCIAVDPSDADKVMVVYSNYGIYSLFYTSDGGTNWIKVAGNLEQSPTGAGNGPSLRWATIIPVSDGTVYLVGTSTGLYATDTMIANATLWVQQGVNIIGNNVVDMMDYRSTDGLTLVATHGNGVFSAYITSVNDISTVSELEGAAAFSIYPNPADRAITISLSNFTSAKNYNITIVNELGMIIKSFNAVANSNKTLLVNVAGLANGLYYINIYDGKHNYACDFIKM